MPFTRWERNAVSGRLMVGILVAGLTMGGTIWAQPASTPNPQGTDDRRTGAQGPDAKQNDAGSPGDEKNEAPRGGAPYPEIGGISNDIPDGYDIVRVGSQEYVFHEGIFYTRELQGFKVVAPPKDAVIRRLPVGFETLIVDGITYFVFADVYYNRTTGGYVVVDSLPDAEFLQGMAVDEKGKSLAVDVDMLNVRSGPGVEHPVVSQLQMGDVVTVQGTFDEWYYVALPDGSYGWLLSKLTRLMPSDPKE